jgi:plasmid maintenance system antidote protein VapI
MTLREYLDKYNISIIEFSEKIGCSPQHLTKSLNGTRFISESLALQIQQATKGEVVFEEKINKKIKRKIFPWY